MTVRIGSVRKGMRVRLTEAAQTPFMPRVAGTVRSPKAIANRPPYEEGIGVYVMWDGFKTPEKWHLADLEEVDG